MTVTLAEAQADLAGLIRRLPPGEELVITEGGRPVAKLGAVPPASAGFRPPPGLLKGAIVILEEDDEHLKDFEEYMR
jgi:antitoxin (DNA-binding transcriptional repressor) of toxin-antitoxin stability system